MTKASNPAPSYMIGKRAPAFTLPDQDGKKHKLSGDKGKTSRRLNVIDVVLPHAFIHQGLKKRSTSPFSSGVWGVWGVLFRNMWCLPMCENRVWQITLNRGDAISCCHPTCL